MLWFDTTGNLTTETWGASGVDYYIGNLWTGFPYSGGAPVGYAVGYYDDPVQFSNSSWFASNPSGPSQAVQDLVVTGFSSSGSNQTTISNVLQSIQTALPSNTKCNNWLQGGGANSGVSGYDAIGLKLANHSFGHGVFNTSLAAAVTGNRNPNDPPTGPFSTGIPSSASFTVNDIGAFFNSTDNSGHQFKYGPRKYTGGTISAQASILIHELGHQLTIVGFLKDFGIPEAGASNNKLVDSYCRQLIEGL